MRRRTGAGCSSTASQLYSLPRRAVAEAAVPWAPRALYARQDQLGRARDFECAGLLGGDHAPAAQAVADGVSLIRWASRAAVVQRRAEQRAAGRSRVPTGGSARDRPQPWFGPVDRVGLSVLLGGGVRITWG
ncbi:hypothetical protein F7R91_06745 [Streptomyces luteolifulvus]|uniref:Uncharacterized protein n=1 Tax=Streptomyces luteolifulvus TaxID=2615112 RepID=A0A6H9V3P5_9ACTN|nr:hypothetical protein F7R91_06745 [Streptomyces luteolifulvus]